MTSEPQGVRSGQLTRREAIGLMGAGFSIPMLGERIAVAGQQGRGAGPASYQFPRFQGRHRSRAGKRSSKKAGGR